MHQLQLFAGLSRARRVMLGVAARNINGSEASRMLKAFLAVDKDFNGTLEFAELAVAAKQVRWLAWGGVRWGGVRGGINGTLEFAELALAAKQVGWLAWRGVGWGGVGVGWGGVGDGGWRNQRYGVVGLGAGGGGNGTLDFADLAVAAKQVGGVLPVSHRHRREPEGGAPAVFV
jgi:hypothetical protein